MRLYSIYYICKKYLPVVESMTVSSRSMTGDQIRYIEGWLEKSAVLNELGKSEPLRSPASKLFETIPVLSRDKDHFDLAPSEANAFLQARRELVLYMKAVVDTYEGMNLKTAGGAQEGFDVMLPRFSNMDELIKCLSDLNFVMNQCPFLRSAEGEIRYENMDVGSLWVSFIVVGAGAVLLLENLSKLVDMAVKVKSHMITLRMQEEALQAAKIRNEIAQETAEALHKVNSLIYDQYVGELEDSIGKLQDGEERDKTKESLKKMAYWMEKGMKIYAAIDAPPEAKNLFPVQEDLPALSQELQKLLEMTQP